MPKGGKVTVNTNSSAILWQRECPATGSTRRQWSGGHQRLMNLISQNKFPSSFAMFRGRQIKKKWALS